MYDINSQDDGTFSSFFFIYIYNNTIVLLLYEFSKYPTTCVALISFNLKYDVHFIRNPWR